MTKEQILPYAMKITSSNQSTILKFEDKNIVGYFSGNETDNFLRKENKWEFVVTPDDSKGKKKTIIDGDKIIDIKIINRY